MIFRMAFLVLLVSACASDLSITTMTPPHFTSLPVLVSGAFILSNTCTSCASAGILLNDISPFPVWAIPILLEHLTSLPVPFFISVEFHIQVLLSL